MREIGLNRYTAGTSRKRGQADDDEGMEEPEDKKGEKSGASCQ